MDLTEWSRLVEVTLRRPPLICCNGKAPLHTDWPSGPWDDPDGWRARLVGHAQNVGMLTGRGVLAVDADLYKVGGEGALEALVDVTALDLGTVTAITGRGGRHLLYSYDPALHVPSIPLEPLGFPGIEVKADGGQVIVEPSIHPDTGEPYRWEEGFGPGVTPILAAPVKLLELLGAGNGGKGPAGGRWQPLDVDQADELDALNIEAARILIEHFGGHDPVLQRGGIIGVYRPGKPDGSASVTIGYIAPGTLKVWSDGWAPFIQGRVYDVAQLRDMAGLNPRITAPPLYVLPPGMRVWTPGSVTPWPQLAAAGRHGPVGRYLDLVEDQTEAGVEAVGIMVLTDLGTLIGRRAGVRLGQIYHHANLFTLVVGETSTGAKGTASLMSRALLEGIDPSFHRRHYIGGFGSGEALIDKFSDDPDKNDKPREKRRVIVENEFSVVLRVAKRESSILSEIIRQGFDYAPIFNETRTGGTVSAHDVHLAVVGSITPAELFEFVQSVHIQNGWLNRFMMVPAVMSRLLPFGGSIDEDARKVIADDVRGALEQLDDPLNVGGRWYRVDGSTPVGALWEPWYRDHRLGVGTGAVKPLTARAVAHGARLLNIFTVLDKATEPGPQHFEAARAWVDLSIATVRKLFGDAPAGKPGRLLAVIREAGEVGMSHGDQGQRFKNSMSSDELDECRRILLAEALIVEFELSTPGRPRTVSVAVTPIERGML